MSQAGVGRKNAGASTVCMSGKQSSGEDVASILARARAMSSDGDAQPAPQKQTMPASQKPAISGGSETVADILARAAAMSNSASSIKSSYNAPSVPPASTRTTSRAQDESVADILARAAAMGGSAPPQASKPSSAPASQTISLKSAPAPSGGESVQEILARAASMGGQSQNLRSSTPAPAPATSQAAVKPQAQGAESVQDILARAASMAGR